MPFGRLGPIELLLILLVVLLVFGVGKLPQVGGAIGKGLREFRKAQKGDFDEDETKPENKDKTPDEKTNNSQQS
ncbi:MAG: twin-arginine translocase TatA/TatE family subunit [Dehalococcoidales bacterium]|nr:twin-arginine translocase TatA/TatE family subunit [Dehalococcoidales bacterium]